MKIEKPAYSEGSEKNFSSFVYTSNRVCSYVAGVRVVVYIFVSECSVCANGNSESAQPTRKTKTNYISGKWVENAKL